MTESWDEFWAEQVGAGSTETIRGVQVEVPTDLPLAVQARAEQLRDSSSFDDVAELVGLLFGEGIVEEWAAAGMGLVELQTVLAWGMAQAVGRDLSFAEAYDAVRARITEGKPQGPTTGRTGRRAPYAPTGGRSRPISSASTGSDRPTSQ